MQLLVIRHAIAEDREAFAASGESDDLRPLTRLGEKRMRRAAPALRHLVPEVSLVATSPLLRARQTADILARAYPDAATETVPELEPEARLPDFLRWLRSRPAPNPIAVVGHEPHLSHLVGWLLSGRVASLVELRKGAAALLQFEQEPGAGEARLRWLLQPAQLRRLAR